MPQTLITSKASSACATYSRCLQYIHIGFRFVRYRCSSWFLLAIALLKLPFVSGAERIHEQIRYFKAIARINFVGVYGLLNDLLW